MDTKGKHLLLEYWGCDASALSSEELVKRAMLDAAVATGATIVGHFFRKFAPKGDEQMPGVSGAVVVAESHLTIHTWPDQGYAAIDVYTCGECEPAKAHKVLAKEFSARIYESIVVERGLGAGNSMRIQNTR